MVGLAIGGGMIFLGTLVNILILGSDTISKVYYASPLAVGRIQIGTILERLEAIIFLEFLVCIFVKASICSFAVCNGISKVFGFGDYRFIATPVTLLMLNFSFFIFKSTMEITSWNMIAAPYYSFVFEVIIPFIVFILVEIRNRHKLTISVIK